MSTNTQYASTSHSLPRPARRLAAKSLLLLLGLFLLSGIVSGLEVSPSTDEEAADSSNTATLTVDDGEGDSAVMSRGEVNSSGDIDWWGAQLVSGQMYRIAMKGSTTNDDRTLRTPIIIGVYKSDDDYVDGTDDFLSGLRRDARVHYYAETTAKHWIAVRGLHDETGTYDLRLLEVEDDSQPDNTSTPSSVAVGEGPTDTFKIDYRGDADWFSVDLFANIRYKATVEATRKILWPVSRGRDGDGEAIAVDRKRIDGHRFQTWFTTGDDEEGTHYIEVRSNTNQTGQYTLEVVLDPGGL